MSDKWEERLRKKLENYEVEPPPGLWEGICDKMGIDPASLEKKPAVSRWWWAVAASILVLVGCFVAFEMSDREQALQADVMSQQQIPLVPSSEPVVAQRSPSQQEEDVRQENTLLDVVAESQPRICAIDSTATTELVQQQEDTIASQQQPLPEKPSEYKMITHLESPSVYEAPASKAKWSVALKASGGLLAANNSMQSYSLNLASAGNPDEMTGNPGNEGIQFPTISFSDTRCTAKHHLPLRLGLSLQYQLHPRLALQSGISYTRLSSEFTSPQNKNISYSQRLHYIGIPLGVEWHLWTVDRLSFYCSGGAMVEKCVSAYLDPDLSIHLLGDYTSEKPWQFSVYAAAGAEYSFMPSWGVYIEPSLGYYFSDGTKLEHYYKEHPLAPSIEFGLRMHLGR